MECPTSHTVKLNAGSGHLFCASVNLVMGHMGSHAKVAPAIQFTTRQGAARPSCHETCVCLLCCLEVVFLDGRLPHCLLDISKQFKMGFLIVARTVQGTPHDTGANDMLKSAGLKLSASASLPALPDGMADKSTLLKVAKKVPQSRAPNKCAETCNLRGCQVSSRIVSSQCQKFLCAWQPRCMHID